MPNQEFSPPILLATLGFVYYFESADFLLVRDGEMTLATLSVQELLFRYVLSLPVLFTAIFFIKLPWFAYRCLV